MSFNFAVKDLAHFSDQTKSSIKASTAVVAVSVIFLNLIQSLGLLTMPEDIQNGTSTLYEIFTQFNSFLIALVMLLAIIIILSKNHSIVQSRKNDINIMKAVGTYPRQLYSFYLTEILLITILSFGL